MQFKKKPETSQQVLMYSLGIHSEWRQSQNLKLCTSDVAWELWVFIPLKLDRRHLDLRHTRSFVLQRVGVI